MKKKLVALAATLMLAAAMVGCVGVEWDDGKGSTGNVNVGFDLGAIVSLIPGL
jgi:hypothetical protein